MAASIKAPEVAGRFLAETREAIAESGADIRIALLQASDNEASRTYARYAMQGCEQVGIRCELRTPRRLQLEAAILDANSDPEIHGILVFFPVFGSEQDMYLRNQVDYRKDVEGLSLFWMQKLYKNIRTLDGNKAILPCTPLAVIKLLEAAGEYAAGSPQRAGAQKNRFGRSESTGRTTRRTPQTTDRPARPLDGKKVSIFNRSEIVGRPLAVMLSNDGAEVFSFDEKGILCFRDARPTESNLDRATALAQSNIIITGVPNPKFAPIQADELAGRPLALNFSAISNFTAAAAENARIFIPRVGPMTVAMCMRNMLRLYLSFHAKAAP